MNCTKCNDGLLATERNSVSDLGNEVKLYLEKKENFKSIFGILACPIKDKFMFRPFFINSGKDEDEIVALLKEVVESCKERIIPYITGKPAFMENHLNIKCKDFFGITLSEGEYVRYFGPAKYEFLDKTFAEISSQYEGGK